MRIIGGTLRGKSILPPAGYKARPTTDFAKENLFNVLNGYIDWGKKPKALDLFAGTGSITLELLSRGCSRVISIEKEALHCRFIQGFLDKLQDTNAIVVRGDVFKYINTCRDKFDIVFADPPYILKEIHELPDMILMHGLLAQDGLLIVEHGKDHDFSDHPRFVDHRVYGSVNFSLFR